MHGTGCKAHGSQVPRTGLAFSANWGWAGSPALLNMRDHTSSSERKGPRALLTVTEAGPSFSYGCPGLHKGSQHCSPLFPSLADPQARADTEASLFLRRHPHLTLTICRCLSLSFWELSPVIQSCPNPVEVPEDRVCGLVTVLKNKDS